MSVLGLNNKDSKSTRDKANISNPKVNRGCAPLTANCTSADCVQISLGPSIPYVPLGVHHTGEFNAMYINKACVITFARRMRSSRHLVRARWGWKGFDVVIGRKYIDGLVQDCSISFANALEILQSYTKPSIYFQDHVNPEAQSGVSLNLKKQQKT